jgi:hypothetical protein
MKTLREMMDLIELGQHPILEYRDRMYQYIKSIVPTWPDYIVKDWLYANFAKGETYNKEKGWSFETIGKDIPKILNDMGLNVNTTWQLVPNVKFTMDMWEPKTLKRLQARAGGSATSTDPMVHIPARDAERHATQAALAQQQGGIRKEPVIIVKTPQGYELLEGWHRTIQHFAQYPDGYTGPAYVATAQGKQSVEEGAGTGKYSRILQAFKIYTNTMGMGMDFYNWANRPEALTVLAQKSGTTPEAVKQALESLNWGQEPDNRWDDEEEIDESADPDAVKRIEQLVQYK